MDTLLFALDAILPIVLLILLGYFLKRIRLFTKEFLSVGNKVCFRVFLPAFLFYNIYTIESLKDVNWVFIAYGAGAVLALFFIGLLCVSLFVRDNAKKGVLLQAVFRSNFAIIGVPLAMSLFGEEGAAAASLLSAFAITEFNVLGVVSLSAFRGGGGKTVCKKSLARHREKPAHHRHRVRGVRARRAGNIRRGGRFFPPFGYRLRRLGVRIRGENGHAVRSDHAGRRVRVFRRRQAVEGNRVRHVYARRIRARAVPDGRVFLYSRPFGRALRFVHCALRHARSRFRALSWPKKWRATRSLAGQLVVWTTVLSAFTLFAAILIFKSIGAL